MPATPPNSNLLKLLHCPWPTTSSVQLSSTSHILLMGPIHSRFVQTLSTVLSVLASMHRIRASGVGGWFYLEITTLSQISFTL